MKKLCLTLSLIWFAGVVSAQNAHVVGKLKVTILSTMLAQEGVGDWGFSALVECDSAKILFDSGGRKHVVADNANELDIDLSKVPALILSHGHPDHTAGWVTLRNELKAASPKALVTTYVAPGFFSPVLMMNGHKFDLKADSATYAASGGKVEVVNNWKEISPGVYLTGNAVPRIYPEKNYPAALRRLDHGKIIPDTIPEDMSMVIATAKGLVVITGCGHSGTMNLITAVQRHFPGQPVYAAIGGFHLLASTDEQINQTAGVLKKAGVRYFMGAHCTGIEPVYQIRQAAGLNRGDCIVGSVGATFDPDKGFTAGQLTMGNVKNAYFKK